MCLRGRGTVFWIFRVLIEIYDPWIKNQTKRQERLNYVTRIAASIAAFRGGRI
jgi:hypothetical protein